MPQCKDAGDAFSGTDGALVKAMRAATKARYESVNGGDVTAPTSTIFASSISSARASRDPGNRIARIAEGGAVASARGFTSIAWNVVLVSMFATACRWYSAMRKPGPPGSWWMQPELLPRWNTGSMPL